MLPLLQYTPVESTATTPRIAAFAATTVLTPPPPMGDLTTARAEEPPTASVQYTSLASIAIPATEC